MSESSVAELRKADLWTGLVLMGIAAGMLAGALSMPLEGTYAGVRNAWYVSPALFPIIVAAALVVLSVLLLANAIRAGAARGAVQGVRVERLGTFIARLQDLWVVGGLLAAYIYILVPRIDFIAATSFLLVAFVATYDLAAPTAARRVLALFFGTAAFALLAAVAGFQPAPRSGAAYARDALVWAAVLLAIGLAANAVWRDASSRPRLRRCLGVSLLTPLILGAIFKYGLLVPLPYEGITVDALDRIRYGVPALLAT